MLLVCFWMSTISLAFVGSPNVKVQLSPYNRVRLMRVPVVQVREGEGWSWARDRVQGRKAGWGGKEADSEGGPQLLLASQTLNVSWDSEL